MMLLSDTAIQYALGMKTPPPGFLGPSGTLRVEPWIPEHLNPASLDLTLSPIFRFMPTRDKVPLDIADLQVDHTELIDSRVDHGLGNKWFVPRPEVGGDPSIVLDPGGFLLMATNEVVTLPATLAARVEGKSSLGRLGLAVHITAGFIDPGFHGSITLEVANLGPRSVVLRPGMRIAQIAFTPMMEPVERPYGKVGHYQDQPAGEPIESRYRR